MKKITYKMSDTAKAVHRGNFRSFHTCFRGKNKLICQHHLKKTKKQKNNP